MDEQLSPVFDGHIKDLKNSELLLNGVLSFIDEKKGMVSFIRINNGKRYKLPDLINMRGT